STPVSRLGRGSSSFFRRRMTRRARNQNSSPAQDFASSSSDRKTTGGNGPPGSSLRPLSANLMDEKRLQYWSKVVRPSRSVHFRQPWQNESAAMQASSAQKVMAARTSSRVSGGSASWLAASTVS